MVVRPTPLVAVTTTHTNAPSATANPATGADSAPVLPATAVGPASTVPAAQPAGSNEPDGTPAATAGSLVDVYTVTSNVGMPECASANAVRGTSTDAPDTEPGKVGWVSNPRGNVYDGANSNVGISANTGAEPSTTTRENREPSTPAAFVAVTVTKQLWPSLSDRPDTVATLPARPVMSGSAVETRGDRSSPNGTVPTETSTETRGVSASVIAPHPTTNEPEFSCKSS